MVAPDPPHDPVFYMTCGRRTDIAGRIEQREIPVMQNITGFVSDGSLHSFSGYRTRYVLDSGGYSAMDEYGGDFPWSVRDYHEWLRDAYETRPFDWAPVMDLACEPAFDDQLTVSERVNRTIEHTLRHWEHNPDYPVLPVLQGRTIDQYIECYERLRDHGIPTQYVGVGTLCRLKRPTQIATVERALRTRTSIDALHGFGIKITAFGHGATFDSADSQAWTWGKRYGQKYVLTEFYPPKIEKTDYSDAEQAHVESFDAYRRRAVWLLDRAHNRAGGGVQSGIHEF